MEKMHLPSTSATPSSTLTATMASPVFSAIVATPTAGSTLSATSGGSGGGGNYRNSTKDVASLHTEIFEFFCTYHRVRRLPSKDTIPGLLAVDHSLSAEQRGEALNRSLYKILNEIELRIALLPPAGGAGGEEGGGPEPPMGSWAVYYDEWAFLAWNLLAILHRLAPTSAEGAGGDALLHAATAYLDYGGKHFVEKCNSALVDLVNKAQRMTPPPGVQSPNDGLFERYYQSYVTTLIALHELYMMCQQSRVFSTTLAQQFDSRLALFKEQLAVCFHAQREFCNGHGAILTHSMRTAQVDKMTRYGYDNRDYMEPALAYYAHMLYNLGVLAARLQGFYHESRTSGHSASTTITSSSKAATLSSRVEEGLRPLLGMVYSMVDVLLTDSLVCVEPSVNPILVTNNLFPMKVVSLCRSAFFKDISLQVVSEETAQQIQQELRHLKSFEPPVAVRPTAAAALLAMKPSTGVKRNNATASAEGGGNTAHKKSDVNSREWISIPPSFDSEHGGWIATYPHLLCTTRQKDTLLEARTAGQTGKRPLFYFHVRAEMFSFTGASTHTIAHTLSLPFTIATRRNQDCQVQRMLSSYTATCFWLYGTKVLDGLLIQWYDNEIDWSLFKSLYAQYFCLNAEVHRSLCDEDFNILRCKMHCAECTDTDGGTGGGFPTASSTAPSAATSAITFKNVLCPHLHYANGKTDLRFSVWRGMLELLHLFSDQRAQVKSMWECGLLQGFMQGGMEHDTVHSLLSEVESGLVARLSFVIGGCVCFTVKTPSGQVLELEPLDIKRLQAKPLHEYLSDIALAEKVAYVLVANHEWLSVGEALKRCQRSSTGGDSAPSSWPTTRTVTSNAMNAGGVEQEQTIRFTALRVAVVACRPTGPDLSNGGRGSDGEGSFEEKLEELLREFGKSDRDLMELMARRVSGGGNVPTTLQLPISSSAASAHGLSLLQPHQPFQSAPYIPSQPNSSTTLAPTSTNRALQHHNHQQQQQLLLRRASGVENGNGFYHQQQHIGAYSQASQMGSSAAAATDGWAFGSTRAGAHAINSLNTSSSSNGQGAMRMIRKGSSSSSTIDI